MLYTFHNYLHSHVEARSVYTPPGSMVTEHPLTHEIQLGQWHDEAQSTGLVPLARQGSNHYSSTAKDLGETLRTYFNSKEGEVPRQWDMAFLYSCVDIIIIFLTV